MFTPELFFVGLRHRPLHATTLAASLCASSNAKVLGYIVFEEGAMSLRRALGRVPPSGLSSS